MGCLKAQKLEVQTYHEGDVLACRYICLAGSLEDDHVSNNSADECFQYLPQQHVSMMLYVDFSPRINENEVD